MCGGFPNSTTQGKPAPRQTAWEVFGLRDQNNAWIHPYWMFAAGVGATAVLAFIGSYLWGVL